MLSQEQKKLIGSEQEDLYFIDHNKFEIANRVFYATIDKFTKQLYPDAKQRSVPYSFRECWHLHNIYSKSQQTLLGIYPIKPSVLLSGDDILFTHEFSPRTQEQDWNAEDYTNMTIGGLAIGDYTRPYINDQKEYEYDPELVGSNHLFRVSSHQSSENGDFYEEEYYPLNDQISSSSDSSVSSANPSDSYLQPEPEILPRSSSLVSSNSFVSAKSNFSYQSLSDIFQDGGTVHHSSSSPSNYGSAITHFYDDTPKRGILSLFIVYILSFWNLIISIFFKKNPQKTPLLP